MPLYVCEFPSLQAPGGVRPSVVSLLDQAHADHQLQQDGGRSHHQVPAQTSCSPQPALPSARPLRGEGRQPPAGSEQPPLGAVGSLLGTRAQPCLRCWVAGTSEDNPSVMIFSLITGFVRSPHFCTKLLFV